MRKPFAKTLSFLDSEEKNRPGPVVLATSLLIAAWVVWLLFSKTTVYAVSDDGRLLAAGAASPIQAPVAGIIAETQLALGAEVKAGAVLLALDSAAENLRRDEEDTRSKGLAQAVESSPRSVVPVRAQFVERAIRPPPVPLGFIAGGA